MATYGVFGNTLGRSRSREKREHWGKETVWRCGDNLPNFAVGDGVVISKSDCEIKGLQEQASWGL